MRMKNAERENSNARSGRFDKQIGSTVYEVHVHFDEGAKEPLDSKILRLIRSDFCREYAKNALQSSENYATLSVLQMERLPERGTV